MARQKTKKVVIAFPTTTQAILMEQFCREQGLAGRLIPVPRQISAGCGMAWSAPAECRSELEQLIEAKEIEVEGLYELVL